jgi:putative modified peptide
LRLLRPVPESWIKRAQQIPLDRSRRGQEAEERGLTDSDLAKLGRRLEIDPKFRQSFDADPVAASEAAGMRELALRLEQELRELVALAERVTSDDVYRAELDRDPLAALDAAGMPAATAEPLLQALGMPEEVLAKLPDVVAHKHEQLSPTTQLLLLLLGTPAVTRRIRAVTRAA